MIIAYAITYVNGLVGDVFRSTHPHVEHIEKPLGCFYVRDVDDEWVLMECPDKKGGTQLKALRISLIEGIERG